MCVYICVCANTNTLKFIRQTKKKQEDINKLKIEANNLAKKKNQSSRDLTKMMRYQKYLESVCEYSPELFEEIPDILSRYDTLSFANKDLKDSIDNNKHSILTLTEEYNRITKDSVSSLFFFPPSRFFYSINLFYFRFREEICDCISSSKKN